MKAFIAIGLGVLLMGCITTQRTAQVDHARYLGLALHNYMASFDGKVPESLAELEPFLDGVPYAGYELVVAGNMRDYPNPARVAAIQQINKTRGGRVVAFLDGHVEWVQDGAEEWLEKDD